MKKRLIATTLYCMILEGNRIPLEYAPHTTGDNKASVLSIQDRSNQLTREFMINTLSHGEHNITKHSIVKAIDNLDQARWTNEFVHLVEALSQKADRLRKAEIIESVAKINPLNYKAFLQTVLELSCEMDSESQLSVIIAVADVNPLNYTESFVKTVRDLLDNVIPFGLDRLIRSVATLNSSTRTKEFILTVEELAQNTLGWDKGKIVVALAKVDPSKYEEFLQTVHTLSIGMSNHEKMALIEATSTIDPSKYEKFLQTVHTLSIGMSNHEKVALIEATSTIDLSTYEEFLQTVRTLSIGMNTAEKLITIEAVSTIDSLAYTPFIETVNTLFALNNSSKAYGIEAIAIAPPSNYQNLIETIKNLSMDEDEMIPIARAVAKIDPSNWTPQFIQVIKSFSEITYLSDKIRLIEAVSKITPLHYSMFLKIVRQLFQVIEDKIAYDLESSSTVGLTCQKKIEIIQKVTSIDPSKWTQNFIQATKILMHNVTRGFELHVISDLVEISPEHYMLFVETVDTLFKKSYKYKSWISRITSMINPAKYNTFIELVNIMASENSLGSITAIQIVELMNQEWLDPFLIYVKKSNFFGSVTMFEFKRKLEQRISQDSTSRFKQFQDTVNELADEKKITPFALNREQK